MLQLYMKRALFNFKGHYRRNEKDDEEKCYNNLIGGKPPLQKKMGLGLGNNFLCWRNILSQKEIGTGSFIKPYRYPVYKYTGSR